MRVSRKDIIHEKARITVSSNINMSDTRIILNQSVVREMHNHATSTYPEECCGLLLGKRGDGATKIANVSERMDNVFQKEERFHRYAIDATKFIDTENKAKGMNQEIIGIYHSHPDSPAKPSSYDTSRAWPGFSYVVIQVNNSEAIETTSWILNQDKKEFVPEDIEIGGA